MGRKIIVTSNCQTAGICAALQFIFTSDLIVPRPYPLAPGADGEAAMLTELEHADVWVFMPEFLGDFYQRWDIGRRFPALRTINICSLLFSAFHPDLCYLKRKSTGQYIRRPYNSAIGFWARKHDLGVDRAARLFNDENYRALGYYDQWNASVVQLKARFDKCNSSVNFARFFLGVKRRGSFMHTINHPKVETLALFAKNIASEIEGTNRAFDLDFTIPDGLDAEVWPLYPEIADQLSLAGGSYVWKVEGRICAGIEAFLEYCYDCYRQEDLDLEDIEIDGDGTFLDHVLGSQLDLRR